MQQPANELKRFSKVASSLALRERETLDKLKAEVSQLTRPDFLWHYLLQSFATMGRASGWHGLIGNQTNYNRLKFERLSSLSREQREIEVDDTCRSAKIRMPGIKAQYILKCFQQITDIGGLAAANDMLFSQQGREAKISFLKSFTGIGNKYARNIMMDVYHPEFRESIAIDARIKEISQANNLTFTTYEEHEQFYLAVAHNAGLNGWELDRLMFNFKADFLAT